MSDIALILSGGGAASLVWAVAALVRTVISRKTVDANARATDANAQLVNADAADKLAGSAIEIIKVVRDDAEKAIHQARTDAAESVAAALRDVTEARRDAAEARREATDARREAMASSLLLRKLISELFRQDASIDRLRRLVNDHGGDTGVLNGMRL